MSQPISALAVNTIVNIVETIGGATSAVPYRIRATAAANPYGSNKVLLWRNHISGSTQWNSSLAELSYENSLLDGAMSDFYTERFSAAVKSCIATSNIKFANADGEHSIARKVFAPSVKETDTACPTSYYDNSTTISGGNGEIPNTYDNGTTDTNVYPWTRTSGQRGKAIRQVYRNRLDEQNLTSRFGILPSFNLYSDCLVSSSPNPDGSYNLIPRLDCSVGSGNTGIIDISLIETDPEMFLAELPEEGDHTFTYSDGWRYDGSAVLLSSYGITVSGVPSNGDTFTVTVKEIKKTVFFRCLLGESIKKPLQAKISIEMTGNPTTAVRICNNYLDSSPSWEDLDPENAHTFTNNTKEAEKWAVGLEVCCSGENDITVREPTGVMLTEE